ncbi:hypothetical protein GW17_00033308 [Ensete ventricosum]|nr:hypothetical protein GW17_00033308 [Ensete ventricosum]
MRGQSSEFSKLLMAFLKFCTRGQSSKFLKFKEVGSSFYQKDVLTPLAPFAPPSSPLLPLYRRRLPLPVGSHPTRGGHPCDRCRRPCWQQGWPQAVDPCGCPAVGPLCRRRATNRCARGLAVAGCARKRRPCWLMPLRAKSASLTGCCPCERHRPPLRAGPGRSLGVGGRPYMGADRGWPPLLLATFTVKT